MSQCIGKKAREPMRAFRQEVAWVAACVLACLVAFSSVGATLERGQLRLHYPEGQEGLALETMEVLQSGLLRYSSRLPAGVDPIQVHICQTREEFGELFGGLPARRVEGFARSREGIIVLKAPRLLGTGSNYAAIARHELLHVLLARNTDPDNLPRWLNEGIAMTLSRENRWGTMFSMARIYTGGRVIEYEELPNVFNAPGNETVFGDAYVQSLSMTRYLQAQVGEERFWAMVRGLQSGPFEEAVHAQTGATLEDFFGAWRASLWRTALISSIVTGLSVFQVAAILLVVGYFRRRARNRRIVRTWDEEVEEGDA